MERLRSWIYGANGSKEEKATFENAKTEPELANTHFQPVENSEHPPVSTELSSSVTIDPEVEKFFEVFPEPYKSKAVERYSRREGLYKWDILRNMAMAKEMDSAKRGIFLEDQREFEERNRQKLETDRKEMSKDFYEREIPPWEQKVLKVVPLQPGDSMKMKLLQTVNIAAIGFCCIWMTVENIRRGSYSRLRRYTGMMGAVGMCGSCQIIAAYRLMDWGPFDYLQDPRSMSDKAMDDFKEKLNTISDYVESITKS